MADNLKTPNPIPIPRVGVLDLPAYVGGRESVEGVENPYKLSANENPLGPSPKAVAAIQALAAEADLAIYPDGGARWGMNKTHDSEIKPSKIATPQISDTPALLSRINSPPSSGLFLVLLLGLLSCG